VVLYIPEHGNLTDLVERLGRQVAQTFQDAETRLLAEIARRVSRDLPANPSLGEQLAVVQLLEDRARRFLADITPDLATEIIAIATREGTSAAVARMAIASNLPQISGITDSAAMAAALVAHDLGNAYDDVRSRILRYPRDAMDQLIIGGDVFQQTIADTAGQRLLGIQSTSETRKTALQQFLGQGVTGFTDRAGRRWRIGSYTEMATRTAVARAHTNASVARMQASGISLGSIVGGRNACDSCAPWFGKILSTDGRTGTREVLHAYEDRTFTVRVDATIEEAREAHWQHPNCSCEFVSYLPGFPVAVGATTYDPEAHAARDRSRELERRLRQRKRLLDLADASGDDVEAARQKSKIRDLQANLREHTDETGQRRRYDREQVRFADGRRS
jgi:hypothetical protein